jgi:hypothetical protein
VVGETSGETRGDTETVEGTEETETVGGTEDMESVGGTVDTEEATIQTILVGYKACT